MRRTTNAKTIGTAALVLLASWATAFAQTGPLGVPSITATAKGPNQINLTWSAVSNPGYGYLIEIQSDADSRYAAFQEIRPVPKASGYTCDSSVVISGGTCKINDPSGAHVYNPTSNGVAPWVTEDQYVDPVDGSPTQFIATSLKPKTAYNFRVRTYSPAGNSAYSNTSTATTSNYPQRFVSTTGNDSNDGTAADDGHAWRTLAHASSLLACGQVLMVKGGNYPADRIGMYQACTAALRAVVLVNPGETATITSAQPGAENTVALAGSNLVVDGLTSAAITSDYQFQLTGDHNALLHVEAYPTTIPNFTGGVALRGAFSLLYGSYLHDSGSPDDTQNPSGNGGFVLVVEAANNNVIWSNHLTRGGHDDSLCIRGCVHNRWLNNIMDGGWAMGFEAIQQSQYNLVEGSFVKNAGQLVTHYKPSFELSSGYNTLRRNISANGRYVAVEVSALYGNDTAAGSLVYNNVFYAPQFCLFQSQNDGGGLGAAAYDKNVWANNICYKFTDTKATDIYLNNKTSQFTYSTFLAVAANGQPQPDQKTIIWAHASPGGFEYPVSVADADKNYAPPFSHNVALTVAPKFVDEANFDFHLAPGSPLLGAGTSVTDATWGATAATADLGSFGISKVSGSSSLAIAAASPLPAASAGVPYTQTLTASGGFPPYSGWTVSAGTLPPGLTLSALGVLSGTPTAPGTFSFTVQVNDSVGIGATKQLTLTVAAGSPTLAASGIVNAGSYKASPVSPGELLTLFGFTLGPDTLVGLQMDSAGHVATSLGGTQVTFDGVPAPLIYAQAGQVGVIAPYAIDGKSTTVVQLSYQNHTTSPVTMQVAPTAPALFTADSSGKGQGSILNQDQSPNSTANPANPGDVVTLYCTGEGQTTPAGVDGLLAAGSTLPKPIANVSVTIGGQPATILYAGAAPGLVAGVMQVNVQLPAGLTGGNQPVVLTVGGVASQAGVTVAVKGAQPTGSLAISFSPNPVTRGSDGKWSFTATIKETAGVGVTFSQFTIGGTDYTASLISTFGGTHLGANIIATFTTTASGYTPPVDVPWVISGNDDNGHTGLSWTATVHFQ